MSILLDQVVSENTKESAPPQQDNPVGDRSPKSVVCNGIAQAGEDDALVESKSLKKQDDTDSSGQSKGINLLGNEVPNDLDIEKVDNGQQKLEQGTKKRGRKPSSSKLTEPSEGSHLVNEREAEKTVDSKSHTKDVPSSPHEDDYVEAAGPSDNDKEIDAKISSPKGGDSESDAVASPSPSEVNYNENPSSKKRRRTKKKNSSVKEVAAEDASKKVSEGASDSEVKPRPSTKKGLGRTSDIKKTTVADTVKKGSGKTEERNKDGGGSSSRQSEDKKKKGKGKGISEKGLAKSSAKDADKVRSSFL